LPPLRERGEDIIILARYFLAYYNRKHSAPELKLTKEDEARLISYDWPGNVRELKNVMERAAILNTFEGFELQKKPECNSFLTLPFADTPSLDEVQHRYIRYVLEKTDGKIGGSGGAAELLGIKRTTLYNRMKKLGMSLTQ
jgi:DNA-binding NtrC family response regulator